MDWPRPDSSAFVASLSSGGCEARGCFSIARMVSPSAPSATRPPASAAATVQLSLFSNIVLIPLCTRAATCDETRPAPAPPAASRDTARAVESTSEAGTAAEASSGEVDRSRMRGRGRHPAPDEPRPQAVAGAGEPAADGPHRPSEFLGGLVVRQAFEVTEHDGGPVLLRQAADLLVENRPLFAPVGMVEGRSRDLGPPPLVGPPSGRCRSAQAETRRATPWSQGPSESRRRIEADLRARIRNVAWKASWASCGSRRTSRQTRRTIGP